MKKVVHFTTLALLLGIVLAACRPDTAVNPGRNTVPSLSAQTDGQFSKGLPENRCGSIASGNLVDEHGNTGSGNIMGADVFGVWDMISTPKEIVIQATVGRGWFVADWSVCFGRETAVPRNRYGNPLVEAFPVKEKVSPVQRNVEIRWPIQAELRCPKPAQVLCTLTLVELDYLGNAFNDHRVWLNGESIGSAGAQMVAFCAEGCDNSPALAMQ